jgi:putative ABC transport system permease protein
MRWLQRLLYRGQLEEELDKELRFHVDQHATELMTCGVPATDARSRARLAIGGPEQVKESCRDARGTRWIEELGQDIRYAARLLRQTPGFAAVSVLTLALGIGATTAIFSAVNPILFEPLPYPHADRIVNIWYPGRDAARSLQAFGTYRELAARSRLFGGFAAFKPWQPTLIGSAEPERLDGQRVTAGYFRVLGVPPAIGRDFDAADDRRNGPNVVILADSLWRRRFHGDRAIVGRQIVLSDNLFTVAGVMPAGFENVLAPSAEIWALLQYDASLPAQGREWGHHLRMTARLRPGIAMEQGKRELDQIAQMPVREFVRAPWCSMKDGLIVNPMQDDVTRAVRPALLAVLGAVMLVLAVACVNVTNLLLMRGAQRRGELAMRAALGAGRTRLVRQLLVEGLLLGVWGGAAGMLVAEVSVRALVALSPPDLPRLGAIHVAVPVLIFGASITVLIGLAIGLIPALHVSRRDLHAGLQQGSRRSTGDHQLTRRTLVVSEVALALMLLVGAGLLLRSLDRLFAVAPGFNPSNVLAMQVQVASARRFPDNAAFHRFYARTLEAVRRVPGVTAAAFTSQLPLGGVDATELFAVQIENDSNPADDHVALRAAVTPGYFELMGIPLIRGRLFEPRDMLPAAARPVLISQSFARRKFPGRDPIGQKVRIGGQPNRPWDVIAGVVGDVTQMSLAAGQTDTVYVATAQWLWADNPLWLVVRSPGDVAALAPTVKQAIWSIDKDQPIMRAATMERVVAHTAGERRFAMILFEAFALAALALAAIGIYGVLAGNVAERAREIGIRTALGATRADILALVMSQGVALAATGTAIGVGGAAGVSRLLAGLLFGISHLDPATYGVVIALLLAVSAIASWIPAWRALRVDPSITLRAE